MWRSTSQQVACIPIPVLSCPLHRVHLPGHSPPKRDGKTQHNSIWPKMRVPTRHLKRMITGYSKPCNHYSKNLIDANSAQQTAFLFNGPATAETTKPKPTARPAKRRKVARPDADDALKPHQATTTTTTTTAAPPFPALFNGAERPGAVRLRRELFETAWPVLEGRIQVSEPEPGGGGLENRLVRGGGGGPGGV